MDRRLKHEHGEGNESKSIIPNDFVSVDASICAMLQEPLSHVTGSRFVALYPTSSSSVAVHNGYGISALGNHLNAIHHAVSDIVVRGGRVESWLVMDRTRQLCWTAKPSSALRFLIDVNVNDTGGK